MRNIFSDSARLRSNDRNGACVRIDASKIYTYSYLKSFAIKLMLVVGMVMMGMGVRGVEVAVSWTATSGALGSGIGSGTISTGSFEWNYTRSLISGDSYTGWSSNCIQLGKNGGVENITFSTSNIPGTIKSVSIECASYNGAHNVSITVGGVSYLSSAATSSWTTVSAKSGTGASSGEISISFTNGTRALYIKSITVVYESIPHTVIWSVNGATTNISTNSLTDSNIPPNPTSGDCDNSKIFVGWTTSAVPSEQNTMPDPLDSRSDLVGTNITADVIYYAVFASASGVESNEYALYSGSLTEGDYIIYYDGKAMNTTVTSDRLQYNEVTPSNNKITTTNAAIIWHIASSGDYWTIYNEEANAYAASTGAKNKAQMLTDGTDDKSLWTVSGLSTYEFVNKKNTANGVNANLRNNGSYGFACYASGTGGELSLYKKTSSAIYSGYVTSCTPPTTATITYNANGGSGSMDSQTVDIGDDVIISANGYTAPTEKYFVEWNTAANGTGASYLPEETITLSSSITLYAIWATNTYNVVWYVNSSPIRNRTYDYGTSISEGDVPSDSTSDDCDGKTFVGWSTVEVDETNTRPSMLSRSDIEGTIVTGSLQYYAVFANADGADVSCSLVTSVSSLSIGDNVVIAAKDYDVAISTTQNNNNRSEASIEKGVGTLNTPLGNDVCVFELRAGTTSGTWAFYDENNNGYIYAASSSSNHLKTQNTLDANGSWTISISNGIATITAQGSNTRNLLRYNNSSSLFSCYGSGQKDVSIYKYSGGIVYSNYSTSCTPCEADAIISTTPLTASDVTINSATIGCAGITSIGGAHCHIRSYGFVYSTSANPTLENGTSEIVGSVYTTTGTAFSKNIEGLDPCTTYHVRAYATNGHGTVYSSDFTFTTVSNAEITSLTSECKKNTAATINVEYSSCTAASDIFVIAIRKGSNVPTSLGTTAPASITANTTFESGYQFGEGPNYSYVVYKSNGSTMPTSLTITGLEAGATYKLKAYKWLPAENKWTTTGTTMTLVMPSVTNLLCENNETSEVLNWSVSDGVCSGGHYVVVCKEGSDDVTSTCANFASITANTAFGSGTQTQTGEFAVYSGSGTTVSITNVTSGTTYTAAVFYVDADGNCSQPTQTTFTYSTTTILEPGDLAIIAINNKLYSTYQNTADEFSFMVFKNITPGTAIDMTDNGYGRLYENLWGTNEGFWRITRKNSSSSIVAGSVITITETIGRIDDNDVDEEERHASLGGNVNIYVNGTLDNSNWTISANGPLDLNNRDQIWIMQGGEWLYDTEGGKTIHNAYYTGNVLYGYTATGWLSFCPYEDVPIPGTSSEYYGSKGSTIYPGCDCFVSTLNIASGIAKYIGPFTEVTKREWIMRINDEHNWAAYTTANYGSSGPNYKNSVGGPQAGASYPLPIASGEFTQGKWVGKKDGNWCNCANWMSLVVPDETIDVEIPSIGNECNEVEIYTGDIAKCKTLTISSSGRFRNTQNNSTLKVVGGITIDAGGTFRPTNGNNFEMIVGGDITNSGTFITNENTSLTLTSSLAQSISAPSSGGSLKLRNLTLTAEENNFDAETIDLYGNLRDNSASNQGFYLPQALTFKGSSSQTSTKTAITNITMDKTSNNLALSGMLTVNGNAEFVKGNIIGNVTFAATATSSGATINSYVDGTVTKKANASAFTFPTGSNGVLGKLEIPATGLAADTDLKFNHNPDGFGTSEMPVWWNQNNMCGPNEGNAKFDHVSNMYFWNLGSSSPMVDAVFTVTADEDIHFNEATLEHEESDIAMAIYDGCWKNLGGTTTTNATSYSYISISDVDLPATRADGDKIVTFGSIDHNTLLPIELVSFAAECKDGDAELSWTTATEHSNDYFLIERSYDAVNFAEVARVAGAGNSISPTSYSHTVYGGGSAYYRLVQVDYDGTNTVSEMIVAECSGESDGDLDVKAYPNPFADDLTLRFENFAGRIALVEVYDMLGRMLVSRKVVCSQNDHEILLPLGALPDGAYNVRVSTEDVVINRQVVKN